MACKDYPFQSCNLLENLDIAILKCFLNSFLLSLLTLSVQHYWGWQNVWPFDIISPDTNFAIIKTGKETATVEVTRKHATLRQHRAQFKGSWSLDFPSKLAFLKDAQAGWSGSCSNDMSWANTNLCAFILEATSNWKVMPFLRCLQTS